MRVVCDTNVLVSAVLSPHGPPAKILALFLEQRLRFCYDARILAEYEEVLARPKFRIPAERVRNWLDAVRLDGEMITAQTHAVKLSDPDDQPFLEVALAGQVECLITGNAGDFHSHPPSHVPILAPAQFLNRYKALFA